MKTYIVEYKDYAISYGNTLFLVKANNKKEAIDRTFNAYFKPENTKENKERGYTPYTKSDLEAMNIDDFFKDEESYICIDGVVCVR